MEAARLERLAAFATGGSWSQGIMDGGVSREEVEKRVLAVVREVLALDGATIELDASIEEDLAANSLDRVTLVMALEEEFGGELPENDVHQLKTVRHIVDYIECRLRTA